MKFFDLEGKEISMDKWVDLYEPYYFLGGNTYKRNILPRNQGSRFIEEKVEEILQNDLRKQDLEFVFAWKIGAIDHLKSETEKKIIYKNDFDITKIFAGPYRSIHAGELLDYCRAHFVELNKLQNNPEKLYQALFNNRGMGNHIGIVYCLSFVYFFTQGKYPIYDKFAHIAADAIYSENLPSKKSYRLISSWEQYEKEFVEKINNIFGGTKIKRKIDRALWVYGHLNFNSKK